MQQVVEGVFNFLRSHTLEQNFAKLGRVGTREKYGGAGFSSFRAGICRRLPELADRHNDPEPLAAGRPHRSGTRDAVRASRRAPLRRTHLGEMHEAHVLRTRERK